MARKTVDHNQGVIAKGCQHALLIAGDPNRLTNAPCEQLGVAAAFLARALARFDDCPAGSRSGPAFQQLESAGKAIGAELRRRSSALPR